MELIGGGEDDGVGPLAERLADGDGSAMEMLYDKFAPQLYAYALGMLGRPEAAEDGLQELFLNLARSRGKLRNVRSVRAYLFAALRHGIWRRLRRGASGELSVEPAAIFQRPQPPGLPEGAAADIESALRKLPAEQREVIVLKVYQSMTFPEIAELTGVSANTATSRYRYALDRLRALLPPDLLEGR
jgi:RNA polymerase sigma-70 factor (ECF subfamily)